MLKSPCLAMLLLLTTANQAAPKPAAPAAVADTAADPLFTQPYIDVDEWRNAPVRHRYVHGGFRGTDTRFSFYFPPKAQYQGRFFQYIAPVPDSETISQGAHGEEDKIGFSISSGAYFIETNGGGKVAQPGSRVDPTIGAYRANAAAARYSRVVAHAMYGGKRPFGYAFGGSGGAFRTIGGMENTKGVWDGAVPFVVGSPMAIPNVFSVRMHAMQVLHDKFPQIVDALEPGGSGDPYAGLNEEERGALREVTRMGFPPRSWYAYRTMGVHAFAVLYPSVKMADAEYFRDFWEKPGYLGFDAPQQLARDRLRFRAVIVKPLDAIAATAAGIETDEQAEQGRGTADLAWQAVGSGAPRPVAFQLNDTPPQVYFLGGDLRILSGAAAGKTIPLSALAGDKVVIGFADVNTLAAIKAGDEVMVDNSDFLAAQTYHRHQVPTPDFYVWDQFRGPDGKPLYPQRPMLLGPLFAKQAAGTVQSGRFDGKMIMLESLWDREAFPWQADWYRTKVVENLGARTRDNFRLWFTDHAVHGDVSEQDDSTHVVSYLGVLQQALRDVAAWVEHGTPPPADTRYKVVDGQVVVPDSAAERGGIQPVVALLANGGKRADVKVGEPIAFTAKVQIPATTGKLVAAHWDFDGSGRFSESASINGRLRGDALLKTTHAFTTPGTYFVTLRVAAQREGNARTPFTRIQNLDRVRVVVR